MILLAGFQCRVNAGNGGDGRQGRPFDGFFAFISDESGGCQGIDSGELSCIGFIGGFCGLDSDSDGIYKSRTPIDH